MAMITRQHVTWTPRTTCVQMRYSAAINTALFVLPRAANQMRMRVIQSNNRPVTACRNQLRRHDYFSPRMAATWRAMLCRFCDSAFIYEVRYSMCAHTHCSCWFDAILVGDSVVVVCVWRELLLSFSPWV